MSAGSLHDRLRPPHPPLAPLQQLQILHGIAYGLLALHDAGIVHLDVKPANILLALLGSEIVAKLTDFGISKSLDPTSTFAGSTMGAAGSLMWMAPELHKRPSAPCPASDVYAFGMVMYEMYTGRQPWEAELQASGVSPLVVTAWVLSGSHPSVPDHVPRHVASLIQRCWDSTPAMRPALPDVISALSHFMAHAGNAAAPPATTGLPSFPPSSPSSAAVTLAGPAHVAAAFSPLSISDVTLLVPPPLS